MTDEHSLVLSFCGEHCRIECPNNPATITALAHDLAAFVSDQEPTLTAHLVFDRTLQDTATPGWKDLEAETSPDGFLIHGPSHWIRVVPEARRIEARFIRHFQVATVLRVGLSVILPMEGVGFLAHAAAVANGKSAYLFPGVSGAGKSTLVANSPGKRCLTEENAVVRRGNDGFDVFGFPLWARLDSLSVGVVPTPLAGMFLLEKGSPEVIPVSRAEALTYLIRSICFPFADREARGHVLDIASQFVAEVPSAQLVFGKNPDFWRCIERD
jgi:hypothetical protein